MVKASILGEVLMFSRGTKSERKFCPPKKTTWYVDGRVKSRLRFYVAGALADIIFLGVRLAEWLRPELWEVPAIKLRGIKPGQILIT